MYTWKEKPFSRVVALMLALLLAVGTLPASPYRANAVDDSLAATFTLVYGDPGTEQDAYVSGSYILTTGNEEEGIPVSFDNGKITISGLYKDTTYTLKVKLSNSYVFYEETVFLTAPGETTFSSTENVYSSKLYCGVIPPTEITGKVTTPGATETDPGNPLEEVNVTVSGEGIEAIALPTNADGEYTVVLPSTLNAVTIKAEKNGYVTKEDNQTLLGEQPDRFAEISLSPINATFSIGANGKVEFGGNDYTSETENKTVYPTTSNNIFKVVPTDGYQIDSVNATSGSIKDLGNDEYSIVIGTVNVYISVEFIKKDTTPPVIDIIPGDDESYYGTPDVNNQCWGNNVASKAKLSITDSASSGETEVISGPATLYICPGTVTDINSAIAGANGAGGTVETLTPSENPSTKTIAVEADKSYTFVAVDAAGNPSQLLSVTFKQDSSAPSVSGASLSPTGGADIITTDNAHTSTASMTLVVSPQDEGGSGVKNAVLYYKEPSEADYHTMSMNPTEDGRFVASIGFATLTELAVDIWDNAGNHMGRTMIAELSSNGGITKNYVLVKANASATVKAKVGEVEYSADDKPNFNAVPEYVFTVSDENDNTSIVVFINGAKFSERTDSYANAATFGLTDDEKQAFLEGENTITITCTNEKGIISSMSFSFVLDTKKPSVTAFSLAEADGTNFYTEADGTFANGPIKVTVTAEDDQSTVNSGLSTITLLVNGNQYGDPLTVTNGQAEFTLNPDELPGKGFDITNVRLSAYATDAAGNIGSIVDLAPLTYDQTNNIWTGGNSNLKIETIAFDLTAPTLTVSNPLTIKENPGDADVEAVARYTGEGAEKKTWFSELIRWNVQVSDGTAGVASIGVSLNGTPLTKTMGDVALSDVPFGFDIASAIADDCSCTLSVTVTDKVGNSTTVKTTIYIDMFAPLVKEFRLEATEGTMFSDASGNYANGPVKVSVKAEDPGIPQDTVAIDPNSLSGNQGQVPGVQPAPMPTSGLAKVVLYLNDEQSTVQFGEATTQENGYYVFTIPADVAENFYKTYTVSAKAYDASGLESAVTALTVGNNGNASLPSEKIIIENKKPGAVITLSDSGKKTIDGNTWYGADTEVKIQATDAESGLSTIAVTVNGVAITADDSETPQAIGTFASKEKSSPVYVIKTANHIASDDKYTIRVTAKDVSGNTYETEATFYIDRKAPTIAGFTVTTEKATDTISSLAFGTFANGRLRVTVTVQDAAPSAGLDFVALTVNDGTPIVAKLSNGVAEFILPEEVTAEFYGAYSLKATAVDVYGHTSEVKAYEKKIEIDTVKPVVSVSAAGANAMAKDGNTWYSSDVTWTIRLTDANAGIASATVKVNGNVISTDANGKAISDMLAPTEAGSVKDVTFAVVSSQGAANADGSYTITVEATDYIGNKNEIYSGTVFVDKAAPSITSFAFLRDGETVSPLTASDSGYVYFFDKDATVVISARDAAAGYGLKTVTYYMEDFNGVKTAEQTVTPDASGNVTITVKAPFRGKIYAKATDGVNNESGYAGSRGFVAESKANHDAAASVSLERNETELKQPNGVDLYSGNVDIKINIADEIAGIKTVEWSVSAPYDQAKNQTGSVTIGIDGTISADGWAITGRDGNLVTGLSKTITVTHDSNDITVRVRMTDWAGNQTERQIVFGIDKVAPTVEYSFDNNTGDRDNPNIFNDERTLTITVTERNFVPGEFAFNIHNAYGSVPTASQWTEERDVQDPNKSTYTATVTFTYDGSYTVGLAYADRAGNRAAIEAVPAFVIDQSKPLVLVTYDNKKPVQDIYFDNFRTATVTVTEKNFDVSRVTFTGNAPRTGSWTANGDEHTLVIYYDEDGDYSFGISVTDKAGNVSVPYDEENFIIDTTAPELDLSGLLAANRGEVAPVITYTDANYLPDGVSILLMRQSGEIISKPYTLEDIVEDGEVKGYRVVFKNFDPMKENDDIYTISISAVDHAGNRTKEIMRRFSVNRFGSTYIMDGAERMNRVNTNNPTDLSVLEINVDEINSADVEIFVIRNSSPKKLEQGVDYVMEEVKSEDADWKEYRYTIKNTAFMEDGEYTIRIISTDKAGNVNENDENGKNGTISFCVDRIAPNIVVVSPVDEESYKEDTHHAVIEVRDNYLLDDVKIYLNDQEISYARNNYQYSFDIPQSDTKQTIRIVATDAAGNVSEVYVKDFLVSTNMFVRFLNTPWAAVTFIVILLGVGAGAVLLLTKKRRRVS